MGIEFQGEEVDLSKNPVFQKSSRMFRLPDGTHEFFQKDSLTESILKAHIDAAVFERDEAAKIALYEQGWIIKKRDDCAPSDSRFELYAAQSQVRSLKAEVAALRDQLDRIIAIAEEDS